MGTVIFAGITLCALIFGLSMGAALWFDGIKDFLESL